VVSFSDSDRALRGSLEGAAPVSVESREGQSGGDCSGVNTVVYSVANCTWGYFEALLAAIPTPVYLG
jgi:hypothetical protein